MYTASCVVDCSLQSLKSGCSISDIPKKVQSDVFPYISFATIKIGDGGKGEGEGKKDMTYRLF